MEELKNQYPDDCIILGNIIKRKNNLKEDDIAGAFSLMQDSLQAYFRWSVIRCEIRSNLKRGERAELKDLLENIVKYLDEVHRDTRVLYKLGREDLRNNRKINSPVIFVPPKVNKHEVVLPNGQLLIDDSKRNIYGWIEHGGTGLIFDKALSEDTADKVKSLEFLLKK